MEHPPLQSPVDPRRLPLETELLLVELLRDVTGSRVELIGYEIANRGHDYTVLVVSLAHPTSKVVVKLAGPRAVIPCPFERTAALHRLVRQRTTVPLPEVLAVDVSYRRWPWRYMVKTHVGGEEWSAVYPRLEGYELDDAYRQIGDAVAQLHGITFQGFGELSDEGTISSGAAHVVALAERAKMRIPSERSLELFLGLLDREAPLFRSVRHARLCHEDLHKHNILFRGEEGRWQLAAILDFDSAWAGHRESDLARLELWRGMAGPGFWEAYMAKLPLDEGYAERRPIYQLLWCLEYASTTPEHLADTRRICARLGLAPVEGFA
ncbi:MAG: phosphotransferase [Chloroflexota bacterium]|nr:phosphotransferase [Chloroflexota bacterium]